MKLLHGDCLELLPTLGSGSVDSCVTDPPYHLTAGKKGGTGVASLNLKSPAGRARISTGFMGKEWDGGDVAFRPEIWAEVLRVLKPGGHVAAFGASRGYHRMACAIEDAGFEIRDSLMWVYGTGFPKSRNLDGEWEGWGTALKPAFEPIVLARKPLSEGTVVANVLRWGTGALNIDGCRIGYENDAPNPATNPLYRLQNGYKNAGNDDSGSNSFIIKGRGESSVANPQGRWPANVVHDGSDEVVGAFPNSNGSGNARVLKRGKRLDDGWGMQDAPGDLRDAGTGSAARFFYSAKASKADRNGSKHPTVKPIALMEWLATLITPPGGTILDPFAGSGTTGAAARNKGFKVILIEREDEYVKDIKRRLGVEVAPRSAPSMEDMLA